jgi:DNA-binding NarL/FixJ family response regulator
MAEAPALRVLLADDAVVLRRGIALVLARSGIDVVGEVDDGEALLIAAGELNPDVVICDIRMPPSYTLEGLVAARELRRRHPGTAVLMLSHHVDLHTLSELFGDTPEGCGYLLKERLTDVEELTDAVRRLAAGGTVVDPLLVSRLVARRASTNQFAVLSPRERSVLALMAEGRSNQAIAARLFLSNKTIEAYISSVFTKLDLAPEPDDHRRVLAAVSYLRATGGASMVPPED